MSTTLPPYNVPFRVHHVKVAQDAFADLLLGRKHFEVRVNDRFYQPHDRLVMTEVARDDATSFARKGGARIEARIEYVHSGYGMDREGHGFVVLGLGEIQRIDEAGDAR